MHFHSALSEKKQDTVLKYFDKNTFRVKDYVKIKTVYKKEILLLKPKIQTSRNTSTLPSMLLNVHVARGLLSI